MLHGTVWEESQHKNILDSKPQTILMAPTEAIPVLGRGQAAEASEASVKTTALGLSCASFGTHLNEVYFF